MLFRSIWRHNMYIVRRPVKDIHIDSLTHMFPVQRAVIVWDDRTGRVLRILCLRLQIRRQVSPRAIGFPHLQEHQGKASYCSSLNADGIVLPMSKAFHPVDILICQIDAAGIGKLPVNDQDFPVIPVIVVR